MTADRFPAVGDVIRNHSAAGYGHRVFLMIGYGEMLGRRTVIGIELGAGRLLYERAEYLLKDVRESGAFEKLDHLDIRSQLAGLLAPFEDAIDAETMNDGDAAEPMSAGDGGDSVERG